MEDRLLARLVRAVSEPDWSLDRLLAFADGGIGVSVTLFVNGMVIEGELCQVELWADKLDASVDAGMAAAATRVEQEQGTLTSPEAVPPGTMTAGDLESLRATLAQASFRSMVDDLRETEAETRKRLEELPDDAEPPADLRRDVDEMESPYRMLTLRNVVATNLVGIAHREIPLLRVTRAHVTAWHMGRASEFTGE